MIGERVAMTKSNRKSYEAPLIVICSISADVIYTSNGKGDGTDMGPIIDDEELNLGLY